jgi:hypothetical protein
MTSPERAHLNRPIGVVTMLPLAIVALATGPASDVQPELRAQLSREFKFSSADLADLEHGKIVKHGLDTTAPGEIAAVGAVRVKAHKEVFVEQYRDIAQFKRGPDVLQIGRFSDPPSIDDLAALTVDKQDLDVRTCRVGHCDIRLPAQTIVRFQREIDWKARDADARAALLFKKVLFDDVRAYLSGDPGRIIEYDDEKRAVKPVDDFAGLLNNSPYLGEFVPGLPGHLQSFPLSPLPGAEDFLYWSKEKFGLTPFITVTHVTITRATSGGYVIASKDVYSSRYFDASLTFTVASDAVGAPDAFYLVYVNRSRASALKGAFSGLRRSIVERRAKSSLDENLRNVKLRLERKGLDFQP